MKRRVVIVLVTVMIIAETLILYNQNKEVREKSNNLKSELQENNLIVDDKVNLEEVKEKKNSLKEETALVFKENDVELTFEEEKKKGEELSKEISTLENTIIGLETE